MIWSLWAFGFLGFMAGFMMASIFCFNRILLLHRVFTELRGLDLDIPTKDSSQSDSEYSFRVFCKIEHLKKSIGPLLDAYHQEFGEKH